MQIGSKPPFYARGVASHPTRGDPDMRSLKAVYNMVEGVVRGLMSKEA